MTASSRPLRERARAFREREMLRGAARLLASTGCRAFTMDALARDLGVSKVTLYAYFRTRDELIARVVGEGLAAVAADLRREVAGRPGRAAVQRAARRLLEHCLSSGASQGDPPVACCLAEVECPFADWTELDRILDAAGWSEHGTGIVGPARALRALAAVAASRARSGGPPPSPGALLARLRI